MAYSNITPPTLPEYDSALYAHYVLEFEYDNGAENWAAVSLRYSSTPFTYDGAAVTNAGEHHLQTYGSGTGEWTYWGILTEMSIAPGTTSTGGYRRIWTNHNILDGSGKVWLAASTATPAEANLDRLSIMKSKLAGLIMAWCAPVRQFPQREPVGYLYGHVAKEGETPTHTIDGVGYVGEVWPDIHSVYTPELQVKYPRAIMCHFFGTSLFVFPEDADYFYSEHGWWCFGFDEYVEGEVGLAWYLIETENGVQWTGGTGAANIVLDSPMVWSNFDLYTDNTRTTLLVPKTDPIPVYE